MFLLANTQNVFLVTGITMSRKVKKSGLVGDLWPHIKLMKLSGLWILEFYEDNSLPLRIIRKFYCSISTTLLMVQYMSILTFLILDSYNGEQMAAGTVTFLFFSHSIVKHIYFAAYYRRFSRLFKWWDTVSKVNKVQFNFFILVVPV